MAALTLHRRRLLALVLAALAATAVALTSEGSYLRSLGHLDELTVLGEVRAKIQSLERSILDAETGQRGFLLTGRAEYREPYDYALKDIAASLQFLEQHYRGNAKSTEVVRRLRALADSRLSELALTMRLHEEGKTIATADIVLSNIGKEKMDEMRGLNAGLLQSEAANVAARRHELKQTLLLGHIGATVLSAMSLLALFMYLRQTGALERQQSEQRRLVQLERDRLEEQVTQRTAQLTELTRHLQSAREDERSRLARDLHDELGALLTAAKLDAARIRSRLSAAPEALERLRHLIAALDRCISLKRRIIEDLRPSTLSNLGLTATLEIQAREFAERCGVQVHCNVADVKLEEAGELVVYRLVQEAITNIAKYAKAANVWLDVSGADGEIEVIVRDDGVGFDAAAQAASGHGLVGMRFRVEAEGGSMTLESAPGQGTRIRVRLPEPEVAEAPSVVESTST